MSSGITNLYVVITYLPFPFFAARRSRLDFGFGPFAPGTEHPAPGTFTGAIPQHLPVVEYFIPFRL